MLMTNHDISVDTLYANGCSWTYGSELLNPVIQPAGDHFQPLHQQWREQHAWPAQVARLLDVAVCNASEPGSSNARILRTAMQDLTRLKLQGFRPLAVIAWSEIGRFELNNGTVWQQFVGPMDRERLPFIEDMMARWWHDPALIEAWCVQAVAMAQFCTLMQIPLLMTFAFERTQLVLSDMMRHRRCADLLACVRDHVKPEQHCLNTSMQSVLNSFTEKIQYGPGGHPLEYGHEILAQWYRREIYSRFTFIT
jgi:hypothetical protein